MDAHAGFGEDVAFIDPKAWFQWVCGPVAYANDGLGLALKIRVSKI